MVAVQDLPQIIIQATVLALSEDLNLVTVISLSLSALALAKGLLSRSVSYHLRTTTGATHRTRAGSTIRTAPGSSHRITHKSTPPDLDTVPEQSSQVQVEMQKISAQSVVLPSSSPSAVEPSTSMTTAPAVPPAVVSRGEVESAVTILHELLQGPPLVSRPALAGPLAEVVNAVKVMEGILDDCDEEEEVGPAGQ